MIMYIVAILSWFKKFPVEESGYEEQFKQMAQLGKQYNIHYVRARIQDFVCTKGVFTGVRDWQGESYVWLPDVQPDLILSRINKTNFTTMKIGEKIPFLTPFSFIELAHDKVATAGFFPKQSPKTLTLSFLRKYPEVLDEIKTDMLILKPRRWSMWIGVQKMSKQEVIHEIQTRSPGSWSDLVIQEYIYMNKWIPWIVDGIHDLRIVCFGEKMGFVIVRTPSTGDFRCNIAQEGKQQIISFEQLPVHIQDAAVVISKYIFELIGTKYLYYSIDICHADDGRVILIELNSSIGLKRLENNNEYIWLYAKYMSQLAYDRLK